MAFVSENSLLPRILLVSAQTASRNTLAQLLENIGFEAKGIPTLDAIPRLAKDWRADIVLVELLKKSNLPDLTFLLRRNAPGEDSLPPSVVILSASTSPETASSCLASGAADFLVKPVHPLELRMRLNNLLSWRARYHEAVALSVRLQKEKHLLSQYLSAEIVDKILGQAGPESFASSLPASIMFFDIRNSTGLGELLAPTEFSAFLSELFTDLMDIIYANNGSVNKLIGDGLLATFGVPNSKGCDAMDAVRCAIGIRKHIMLFNQYRPDYLKEPIGGGVGVASGVVFAGTVGSYRRKEYTVLGDCVNIASRLESLTKLANTDILIDGNTAHQVLGIACLERVRFDTIRGRIGSLEIYKVHDLDKEKPQLDLDRNV